MARAPFSFDSFPIKTLLVRKIRGCKSQFPVRHFSAAAFRVPFPLCSFNFFRGARRTLAEEWDRQVSSPVWINPIEKSLFFSHPFCFSNGLRAKAVTGRNIVHCAKTPRGISNATVCVVFQFLALHSIQLYWLMKWLIKWYLMNDILCLNDRAENSCVFRKSRCSLLIAFY